MFDFTSLLDWKLLTGSHAFPGPDGGTCINEAAIVAAGLPYRRVCSIADCPPCFSRPLAAYALGLNDGIGDHQLRQKLLLPFITRLAGSADSPEVESARVRTLLLGVATRVLPQSIEINGCVDAALACRSARSIEAAAEAVHNALDAISKLACGNARLTRKRQDYLEGASNLVSAFVYFGHYGNEQRLTDAASCCATAAIAAASVSTQDWSRTPHAAREPGYILAAELLDQALKIGNRAEPIETEAVAARFTRAKRKTPACEPVS